MGKSPVCCFLPTHSVVVLTLAVSASGCLVVVATKDSGSWREWTFRQYQERVRCAAKAFIKVGLCNCCCQLTAPV